MQQIDIRAFEDVLPPAHRNPCTLAILTEPKDLNLRSWGDTFQTRKVAEVLEESYTKLRKTIMQKFAFYVSIPPDTNWKANLFK